MASLSHKIVTNNEYKKWDFSLQLGSIDRVDKLDSKAIRHLLPPYPKDSKMGPTESDYVIGTFYKGFSVRGVYFNTESAASQSRVHNNSYCKVLTDVRTATYEYGIIKDVFVADSCKDHFLFLVKWVTKIVDKEEKRQKRRVE